MEIRSPGWRTDLAVLTRCTRPRVNTEATFRTLAGDADWRQSLELAAAVHAGEPGGEFAFLTARQAAKRALTEAGHGAWFGAFRDGTLVAQLGLIRGQGGLARYQDVETHPGREPLRRRRECGAVGWWATTPGLSWRTSLPTGRTPR